MFCSSNPSNQHPQKKFVKKFRLRALRQNKCDWISGSWSIVVPTNKWCSSFIAGISFNQTRFLRTMKIADNMRRTNQTFWREIEVFFCIISSCRGEVSGWKNSSPLKMGPLEVWRFLLEATIFKEKKLLVSGSVAIMIDSLYWYNWYYLISS